MDIFGLLLLLMLSSPAKSTQEVMFGSYNCTALSGLYEFPCIIPYYINGTKHDKCAILDDDMVLPECPVSKDLQMWGVCNKNCFDHGNMFF